jgi:hypothetical protein
MNHPQAVKILSLRRDEHRYAVRVLRDSPYKTVYARGNRSWHRLQMAALSVAINALTGNNVLSVFGERGERND